MLRGTLIFRGTLTVGMGVESGGGGGVEGRVPRSPKFSRGRPPEIMLFQYVFFSGYISKLCIF